MDKQLKSVVNLIKEKNLHWISYDEELNKLNMFLDNSLMSCFRSCQSLFMNQWVEGYYLKTGNRQWYLEFGSLFHEMVEIYYKNFKSPDFSWQQWATDTARNLWVYHNMDSFSEHKEYKSIGGLLGFSVLLISYAQRWEIDNERLNVIAVEIPFGKNKEVYLGSFDYPSYPYCTEVNVYLSGRIDILVDDGQSICPLDHKTKSSFRTDPQKTYEISEGPTGYVYAVNKILPQILATQEEGKKSELLTRDCNKIIMNYISKAIPAIGADDRFRRVALYKTKSQLADYSYRMLLTAEDLLNSLKRYSLTGVATRSDNVCTSLFGSECVFYPVHRQNSRENELLTLKTFYEKRPIWDTENPRKGEKENAIEL